MISLDHPCEIENGVLKYTFLLLRNNADYCCISSHEDILLLQRAIAHPMLLCVGGHNNIFLFMQVESLWSICPSVSTESHNNLITDVAAHILSYFACPDADTRHKHPAVRLRGALTSDHVTAFHFIKCEIDKIHIL